MNGKCGSCGHRIESHHKFCYSCGALSLVRATQTESSDRQKVAGSVISATESTVSIPGSAPTASPTNSRKLTFVVTAILVGVIGLGAAIAVLNKDNSSLPTFVTNPPALAPVGTMAIGDSAISASSDTPSERSDEENLSESLPDSSTSSDESSTATTDESTADSSDTAAAYIAALGSWSSEGFAQMMDLAEPGSPAWSYAFHLSLGRRSERQSGGGDGRPLEVLSDGSNYKICFTPSCSAEISDIQVSNGLVNNFWVNGRDLSESISVHPGDDDFTCGTKGICAALRSTFWFGGTTYSVVEIAVNDPMAKTARNISVALETSDGATYDLSSGSTPKATPDENAYYSLGFRNTPEPWNGVVIVRIRTALGSETLRLVV